MACCETDKYDSLARRIGVNEVAILDLQRRVDQIDEPDLEPIKEQIRIVELEIIDIRSEIAELNTDIDGFDEDIDALTIRINNLQSDLSAVNVRITNVQSDLSAVSTRVTANTNRITTVSNNVTKNTTDITGLRDDLGINIFAPDTFLDAILMSGTEIAYIKDDLEALTEKVNNLPTGGGMSVDYLPPTTIPLLFDGGVLIQYELTFATPLDEGLYIYQINGTVNHNGFIFSITIPVVLSLITSQYTLEFKNVLTECLNHVNATSISEIPRVHIVIGSTGINVNFEMSAVDTLKILSLTIKGVVYR